MELISEYEMVEVVLKPLSKKTNLLVLEQVQNLNQERQGWNSSLRSHAWRPPTDVYEINDAVIVRVEIAGMNENDFAIFLDGKALLVRGVRPDVTERRAYHQMEIRFGEFLSQVDLPFLVDVERIEAIYNNGILRIVLPRLLPQQVSVKE